MTNIHRQAGGRRAGGVVGTELEEEAEEYEVDLGNDQERTDMIFTFHAMGTAIAETAERPSPPPMYQAIDLRS
jgi:capsid portal protein